MEPYDPKSTGGLSPDLLAAYRSTEYWIDDLQVALKIGQGCPPLDRLLADNNLEIAVFITAWNPRSKTQPDDENRRQNTSLKVRLERLGFVHVYAGEGRGADDAWVPESSFLVLGMSSSRADALAADYAQNAYVYYEQGRASLMVCPPQASEV